MPTLTITEALAEIKLIDSKVQKKQEYILNYASRNTAFKDPLKDSPAVLANEQQSVRDLLIRKVNLRAAIARANAVTSVTIGKESRTLADWIVWKREAAPIEQKFLTSLRQKVEQARAQAVQQRLTVAPANIANTLTESADNQLVINIDEKKLNERAQEIEEILGILDGQLSLKNATVLIEV